MNIVSTLAVATQSAQHALAVVAVPADSSFVGQRWGVGPQKQGDMQVAVCQTGDAGHLYCLWCCPLCVGAAASQCWPCWFSPHQRPQPHRSDPAPPLHLHKSDFTMQCKVQTFRHRAWHVSYLQFILDVPSDFTTGKSFTTVKKSTWSRMLLLLTMLLPTVLITVDNAAGDRAHELVGEAEHRAGGEHERCRACD